MGYSVMSLSVELLVCVPHGLEEFHPMGYIMSLFLLGTQCHTTAFP